jgi:hypothetical protein
MLTWPQRIGHHISVRLTDGRAISGYLLNIDDQTFDVRESAPGEWNSLAGPHIQFTLDDLRSAFDNTVEEMVIE